MSFQVSVVFGSSSSSPRYTITDFISQDDWTYLNYRDDLGAFISEMISEAEDMFRKLYPDGHDYELLEINVSNLGDGEE